MRSFEIDPDYMHLNAFFFFFYLGKLEITPEMVTLAREVGVIFYGHTEYLCNVKYCNVKYFLNTVLDTEKLEGSPFVFNVACFSLIFF